IAAKLGAPQVRLEMWAAQDSALAAALALAETEARAWWDRQPREALASGKSFRAAAWAKAMAQRYGSRAPSSTRPAAPAAPAEPEVIFEFPDNGTKRRRCSRRPRRATTAGAAGAADEVS